MGQYIPKSALVAEIKRRITTYKNISGEGRRTDALMSLKNFIDTLEVKDLQEEPVSEELEKVADQYSQGIESDYINDMFDRGDIYEAVIYGAQWQEHRDSSLYENTKKMWEEIDKQYDDGFATGQKLLREQMLKEAFEVPVVVSKIGEKIPSIAFGMPYSNYKDGDKVKLIIIKED